MTRISLQHLPADVFGLPDWARVALAHRPQPKTLAGVTLPATIDDVPRLDAATFDDDDRKEIAALLEANLAPFEPHVKVVESVRALRHPEAAIVFAGQQPGFLGGPLYNIYKALHAIRLARALSEAWGTPVVPAFWNHADDHDIGEVHHLWLRDSNLDLRKVGLAGVSSGRAPLYEVRYDAEENRLGATLELLEQNLWRSDERAGAIELFMPRDGETFSGSFSRVMLELFGAHGLVVVEPQWIRPRMSRSLASIVTCDVRESLRAGSERLRELGREPAIDPETAAIVFHLADGKRNALRFADGGFSYDGEAGSRTPTELAAEIVQAPFDWSPGALLRPLVQDHALPTVAYVGGWGELAYHTQLVPLRERANVARTAFVPRLSATIVEPSTRASLEKVGTDVRGVLAARGKVEDEASSAPVDSKIAARLRAIAEDARAALLAARPELVAVDKGLGQQLKKVASQVTGLVDRLAERAERSEQNASGTSRRHVRRIATDLYPRDKPQERVIGMLELVSRYGRAWIDALGDEIEPLPTEHLVVQLEEGDAS